MTEGGIVNCPGCRSKNVHRSRSKSLWEGLRHRITRKRPYRCRDCNWRGWGADRVTSWTGDARPAPDPPNLRSLSLARDRRPDVDLDALDAAGTRDDERT